MSQRYCNVWTIRHAPGVSRLRQIHYLASLLLIWLVTAYYLPWDFLFIFILLSLTGLLYYQFVCTPVVHSLVLSPEYFYLHWCDQSGCERMGEVFLLEQQMVLLPWLVWLRLEYNGSRYLLVMYRDQFPPPDWRRLSVLLRWRSSDSQ